MNLKNLDYKVERTENCVLIDTTNWLENVSNIIKTYYLSGKDHVNYMTKVLAENIDRKRFGWYIKEGDSVAVTRIVADVARYRAHALDREKKYYDVPIMQIIGKFVGGVISFNTLVPVYDKLLMEKVDPEYSKILVSPSDNTTVCKVLKTGFCRFDKNWNKQELTVKEGDIVLVKDNVTTELELDGKMYLAVEEAAIVAVFNDPSNLSLDNARIINESILMKQYIPRSSESGLLLTPDINYEDLDYSDTFNKDLLEVKYIDSSLTKLKQNDIVLMNRDITNYVIFNREKYFITNGMLYIEGKEERV